MTRIDHSGHDHLATPAARAECRKATANVNAARELAVDELLARFDAQPWFAGHLEMACRRVCCDAHQTFTRNLETGRGFTTVHHTCRRACAYALVDRGITFSQVCMMYS
jgi:hypothetical protein